MSGFGSNGSGSGGGKFKGNRVVTRNGLPAINVGNVKDLAEWVEKYFFPAVPPGASLIGGNTRQFGASPNVTLNWIATKNTFDIEQITVNGDVIIPTGNTQSGTLGAFATSNVNTTFQMSVKAGSDTVATSTTVVWSHKRFWGKIQKGVSPILNDGSVNPAFTISDAQILALTGAGIGTGNEFASSRAKVYNGINGGGEYLIFAFPTTWGTPSFTVNGLPNTAFTKVRDTAFINSDGYSASFQVWVSNTEQNSPIALFSIS
jgi:hypothetical protein